METEDRYVAFFDIDKTILNLNSARVLVIEAYKRKLMPLTSLLYALYLSFLYKFNLAKTTIIVHKMTKWMKGVDTELFKNFALEIVNNSLIQSIRPEIQREINFHKSNGAHIAVLSSALPEICIPLAQHMSIDDVICSKLETNNGYFTGFANGILCFGKEKLIQMTKFCNKNNYNINKAWYYADSITDAPVLLQVGNPVCVNPDNKLKKLAEENNWRII